MNVGVTTDLPRHKTVETQGVPRFGSIVLSDAVEQPAWKEDCFSGFGLAFEKQPVFVWIVDINFGEIPPTERIIKSNVFLHFKSKKVCNVSRGKICLFC